MSEPPNSQRSATRAPVDKPIRLQFDDSLEVDEGHCINISIGGLYVHTGEPRPAGTLVRFELELDDEQSIRGLGEVAWQQRTDAQGKGVGIKFRFLEQRDRQMIFKLVSQHIKARLERENDGVMASRHAEPRAPEAAAFSAARQEALEGEVEPSPSASGAWEASAASNAAGLAAASPTTEAPALGSEPPAGAGQDSATEPSIDAEHMDETIPMTRPLRPQAEAPAPVGDSGLLTPEISAPAAGTSVDASVEAPVDDSGAPPTEAHEPTVPAASIPAPPATEAGQSSLFDRWDPPTAEAEPASAAVSHLDAAGEATPAPPATPSSASGASASGASAGPAVDASGFGQSSLGQSTLEGASTGPSIFGEPESIAGGSADNGLERADWDHGADGVEAVPAPKAPEVAGAAQASSTRRRRRASSSGLSAAMWALLLALGVAIVSAYLLRDRLFSGIVGDSGASAPAPAADEAENEPAPEEPSITGPGERSNPANSGSASDGQAQSASSESAPGGPQETTLAEEISDPGAARRDPGQRPARPGSGQATGNRSNAAASRPAPASAVPPKAAPPARDGHAMRRLVDISWRPGAEALVVTLVADGTIAPPRVKRFRLGGPTPREVVVLTGMSEPFGRNQMPVAEGGVASIRTGFHTKRQGNEVHVVMDLSDPTLQLVDIRHLGKRLELIIGSPGS